MWSTIMIIMMTTMIIILIIKHCLFTINLNLEWGGGSGDDETGSVTKKKEIQKSTTGIGVSFTPDFRSKS